jgi:hypothetical protein
MWLWSFIALCGAPARAEVVDRLVAVVAAEPLLSSQVRLDRDLAPVDPSPVPFWRMSPAAPEREDGPPVDVQRSIDALVLRETASDVALYQPTREQLTARIAALAQAFGGDDEGRDRWETFLATHGLDPQRLESVVRRRMVVERFLLRNLQGSPDDPAAWTAECRAMVAALRARTRIRTVEALESGDEGSGDGEEAL